MRFAMVAGLLSATLAAGSATAPRAPDLAWLAGSWCGEAGGTVSEEIWMAPRGGLMLGMHRDTRAGRAAAFEFLRIELRNGTATYLAQPGGRAATAFELRSASAHAVTFANDRHDFPKRVIYERVHSSRLKARVDDGTDEGTAQEWIWAACARQEGF
jgi:hypothetical protein